jgi:hypothetical protein
MYIEERPSPWNEYWSVIWFKLWIPLAKDVCLASMMMCCCHPGWLSQSLLQPKTVEQRQ